MKHSGMNSTTSRKLRSTFLHPTEEPHRSQPTSSQRACLQSGLDHCTFTSNSDIIVTPCADKIKVRSHHYTFHSDMRVCDWCKSMEIINGTFLAGWSDIPNYLG